MKHPADFVNLKVTEREGTKSVTVRLVGPAYVYMQHVPYSSEGPGRHLDKLFPDHNEKWSFARRWGDEAIYGPNPWKENGYQGTRRFAWNCLERVGDKVSVKILERGIMFARQIEAVEEIFRARHPGFEHIGGAMSCYIEIVATYDSKNANMPTYTVMPAFGYSIEEPSREEIDLLYETGEPDWEYLSALKLGEPPHWMWAGHPLHIRLGPDAWPGTELPKFGSAKPSLLDEVLGSGR